MTYEQQTAEYERQIREYHAQAFLGGFTGIPEEVRLREEIASLREELKAAKAASEE